MSEMPLHELLAPDLADRMTKALRVAHIGKAEMAEYLGVSRNTIGNYTNGRRKPGLQTLRLWSMRCGVPLTWLKDGIAPTEDDGGDGVARPKGFEPLTFWLGVRAGQGRILAPLDAEYESVA